MYSDRNFTIFGNALIIAVCSHDCTCRKHCKGDPNPYGSCPVKAGCDLSCKCPTKLFESRTNGRCVIESPDCPQPPETTAATTSPSIGSTINATSTTAFPNVTATTLTVVATTPSKYHFFIVLETE